ncbi:putative Zn(2)-C6 fungal-type domain-containing protein [Seiridium cardinale]|uniref:Zn(2)-C6 fungal-type domain-containing protein n=1 Tax=Seiridium cardinale TaxID=138064 RepID=A0ABR2Y8F6_9PEZI
MPYIGWSGEGPDYTNLMPPPLQVPPLTSTGDAGFNAEQSNFPAWLQSSQMHHDALTTGDFLALPSPMAPITSKNDTGQCQAEDTAMFQDSHPIITDASIPNLQEIRELNSAATYPPLPPLEGLQGGEDESNAITKELAAFTVTVFTAQSDIAGISLVLAEYLEWMRKGPTAYNHANMLEKLESRAREVHDIARTRHYVAWKSMVAALERHQLGSRLRELEGGVCRTQGEIERFFHAEYDVKSTLSDQRKPRITEAGSSAPDRTSLAAETQLEAP